MFETKKFLGEEKLRKNTAEVKPATVKKLAENVYSFQHFGASNATLIIGERGCTLVDVFESDGYALDAKKEIENITKKPVTTIIYTHTHADHTGGAIVFSDTVKNVIAHVSHVPVIGRQSKIAKASGKRAFHQFGVGLSMEESISMGLNPAVAPNGNAKPLPVTQYVDGEETIMNIDGVSFHLIAVPGETDDEQAVWLPDQKILCSGDNYYASWPNLCALRGSTYRDVNQWVVSLGKYLDYQADFLVPGHGEILEGQDQISLVIGNYRDAIEWVLDQTLNGINEGKTPDELAASIRLPEKWASLPYLQEYYGTVEWSVRGIYSGYIGWFDGNPTHISALPIKEHAEKQLQIMGGEEKVLDAIKHAVQDEDMQWAMELCDVLLNAGVRVIDAKKWKAQACIYLGRMQTSANGRHYYLSCAKELEK